MEFVRTLWAWFNGNKTLLGVACLALAPFFPDYTFAHEALLYVGGLFGSVGIAHKVIKGTDNT